MSVTPINDRPEEHICRECRHRREGCVRRVTGTREVDQWVCRDCLEGGGQISMFSEQKRSA